MGWGDHSIMHGSYRATSSELSRQQGHPSVIPYCHKQKFPAASERQQGRYIIQRLMPDAGGGTDTNREWELNGNMDMSVDDETSFVHLLNEFHLYEFR